MPIKKIAFLGWAFKKDTNDTRESAAIYVADDLINEEANLSVYDPKVPFDKRVTDLNYLATLQQIKICNIFQPQLLLTKLAKILMQLQY